MSFFSHDTRSRPLPVQRYLSKPAGAGHSHSCDALPSTVIMDADARILHLCPCETAKPAASTPDSDKGPPPPPRTRPRRDRHRTEQRKSSLLATPPFSLARISTNDLIFFPAARQRAFRQRKERKVKDLEERAAGRAGEDDKGDHGGIITGSCCPRTRLSGSSRSWRVPTTTFCEDWSGWELCARGPGELVDQAWRAIDAVLKADRLTRSDGGDGGDDEFSAHSRLGSLHDFEYRLLNRLLRRARAAHRPASAAMPYRVPGPDDLRSAAHRFDHELASRSAELSPAAAAMNHCGAETRGQPPVSPDYLRDQLLASAHDHPFDHLLYGSLQNDVDVAPAHQMPDYLSDKGPL